MNAWWKAVGAVVVLAVALPAASAIAEDGDDEGIQAYSVARLRIFQGTAWVRPSDSGEWEEFTTNSPVPERARISVPEGSEAELQFHGGQGVLLTAGSEVDVRQLGDQRSAFGVRAGEIRFDLPEADFAPVGVRIPGGGSVAFPVPGRYWVTARDDGDTRLVVRAGRATVARDGGDVTVNAGDEAAIGAEVRIGRFTGAPVPEETAPELTDAERDAGVPPYAAEELRDYGEWVESSGYGYVWRPRVAVGWSPYYYGRWDWVSPFGWTWVSFEPWGWWPYHYGYWYTDPFFGWVWSPYRSFVSVGFSFGSFHTRHFLSRCYFSPATVRFVRDGRNVRWVPLRPGERAGRAGFTRSDGRLAGWERPLSPGKVFVRQGREGGRVWRDYSTVRGERRPVVRESVGRAPGGGAPGVPRARESRPGVVERPRAGERGRGFDRPGDRGDRGGGTDMRRQDTSPRPGRMDREGPRRSGPGRDSRIERRYDVGDGPVVGRRGGREFRTGGDVPRAQGGRTERFRSFRGESGAARRETRPAFGVGSRAQSVRPSGERIRGMDSGSGRFTAPGMSGRSEGSWNRGGGRDRDLSGFGGRGGHDRGGGRGGR